LKGWARSHDLIFVPEYEIATPTKDRRYVDAALVHALRVPFGYWVAKDEKDDLEARSCRLQRESDRPANASDHGEFADSSYYR